MVRRSSGGTRSRQGPMGVAVGVMVGVGVGVMVGVLVGVGVGVGVGELGIVNWELLVVACGVWVWVGVGSWARAACLVMEGVGVETTAAWQATRQRARMDIKQWAFRMGANCSG